MPSRQFTLSTVAIVVVLAACGDPDGQTADTSSASTASRSVDQPTTTVAIQEEDPTPQATTDQADNELGEPLEDPERFYGLYANPDTPDRQWFVVEARKPLGAEQAPDIPPGYLMISAMFGDVSPWVMRTLSDTTFEQVWANFSPEPAVVEFSLDDERHAISMTFTNEQLASEGRLERVGDPPDGW